jgi:hypothetical protein
MAKLKAHGTELLRLRREFFIDGEKPVFHSPIADPGTTITDWVPIKTKHYEELSYRSDGKILRKSGYWQTGSPYQTDHWYDWGWKLYRKLRPGVDPIEHAANARKAAESNPIVWRIA